MTLKRLTLLETVNLYQSYREPRGTFEQEINITMHNLCKITMFFHDIGFEKFDMECEDTLTNS